MGAKNPLRTLRKALIQPSKKYEQIEKGPGALSLVSGVKKFHQYQADGEFIVRTNRKPLVSIFGSKKGVPMVAVDRLQRCALALMAYTFSIE